MRRGKPDRDPRATTREAAVYELAGAILGIAVMAGIIAKAYLRYGWAPDNG